MAKFLVIVESPAKCKTIGKFLGRQYIIRASYGHVRDLPNYRLAVNINDNFKPTYVKIKDKTKILEELSALAKKSEAIYIATDPDREGEAIAWHIAQSCKIPAEKIRRIVFNEITKTAILGAIDNCRGIDDDLVDAQQARRILDRLIGYKLSPILSKKIRRGLSAGRVQSVAVKIICDRENEISIFVEKEYWTIDVTCKSPSSKNTFQARLFSKKTPKTKLTIENKKSADEIITQLKSSAYSIQDIKKSTITKQPPAPFITSTLQQEASKKFNWSTKKTMLIAQQLYEGMDIKGESSGLITYMRTDSTRISEDAKESAKSFISSKFGDNYIPATPRQFKKKKGIQDAHEAIRPTFIDKQPQDLKTVLAKDHYGLYKLIWDRFMSSQMHAAIIDNTLVIVEAETKGEPSLFLKASGNDTKFDGYTRLYSVEKEDMVLEEDGVEDNVLPSLAVQQKIDAQKIAPQQKFTQPPPRYTEAGLVRELEEKGIGRPSTYAPIISTIVDRNYVLKEKRILKPTDLGNIVNSQLSQYFDRIIDLNFTADMEKKLDEIMEGKHDWQKVIKDFFNPFQELIVNAQENMEKINLDKPTEEKCPKCESQLVIKQGRFGEFFACSDYPNCKFTKSMKKELGVNCPNCQSPILEKKSKRGKIFYGCSNYPGCKYAVWDKPVQESCPKCNFSILLVKAKNDKEKYCPDCQTPVSAQS